MDNLVSVIIPVYNVEKYIKRCIDSVVNQTYKKIEIILIDDGSLDKSSKICDEYKEKDSRIEVFHKKNGGLSDARNYGLKKSKGKFVIFVDSDDWIPSNAIEIMIKKLIKNNVDIVSGKMKEVYSSIIKDNSREKSDINTNVMSTEKALEKLMYLHNFSNSASAKIYKKNLFENVEYPKGKLYEDLGTTYKVFAKAKKIASIDSIVYYYYQNNNESIMHKEYDEKRLDGLDFAIEELNFINQNFPNIKNAAIFRLYYECIAILNDMPFRCKEKKYVKQYIKKYKKIVLHDNNLYKKQKLLSYAPLFGQVGIKFAFKIKAQIKKDRTL